MTTPFATMTGDMIARVLNINDVQLRHLVQAGTFPQPDYGCNDPAQVGQWAWNMATVATAVSGLSQASIAAALKTATAPLPDGTPAVKPHVHVPFNRYP